jgi:hypothetical protein
MLLVVRGLNALGKPFGINPIPRAFHNKVVESADRAEAFEQIFRSAGWDSDESLSGPGSEVARASAYRGRLRKTLDEFDLQSVFDAPCGDLNWILPAVEGRRYIGGDIAESLIAQLEKLHPQLDLRRFDICTDRFPEADVWHCRDCLFHLPFDDIVKALTNFARSKIPYALLTTHKARLMHRNLDVPAGGWRYLDLEREPIGLPTPIRYLKDYRIGRDFPRYVGLWSREQVSSVLD